MRRVCVIVGIPPAMMLKSLGHPGGVQPADERRTVAPVGERLVCVPHLARLVWRHVRAAHVVRRHEIMTADYLARLSGNPEALPDEAIWSRVEQWTEEGPAHMQVVLLLGAVLFHEGPLQTFCDRIGFSFERLVYPQLAAGTRSVSAQQAYDLVALARTARHDPQARECLAGEPLALPELRRRLTGTPFLAALERFLEQYGHRGLYESDWALPRYREDPTPLLRAIRGHLEEAVDRDPSATAERQAREAAEAWAAFDARLTTWQRWTRLPVVRRSIRRIKQYYLWREQVRSDMVRVLAVLRQWHLALAARFVDRGWLTTRDDYFLLTLADIGSVIREGADPLTLRARAAERKAETERRRGLAMPLLMRESELPRLLRTARVSGAERGDARLSGHPVSAGCVEAHVVVVHDPGDFGRMKRGAILVARATDPSWTPLFTLASGVIVEVGGVLSHASTVAREYGLPALANVKQATRILKTGDRVRLDAVEGYVERIAEPPAASV
jgi:pyruvate,water dikinase